MYAVIEISGKQQIVKKDEIIKVDRLNAEKGESVTVNRVLALGEGENMTFGTPLVKGASVIFEVLENRKDKKVIVFKKKRRKRYEVKRGHRQYLSVVKVKDIIS
ncbi:MAG: 50S ribosomal protein L21 [Candidatus Delongbacteria bacterium]|jgi:large subunit ribosomal protein L21|nr:50S ribosomal protein L21 [Candidatus Delongbacteria bacterium]MDY0017220.1 50S ribosomal protein L21 [Candidatus Delongbacteria bacterium]